MAVKMKEEGCLRNAYTPAELMREHSKRKADIRKRLDDFSRIWALPDKEIFAELCFCICTPQSKAVYCDKAIKGLYESGKLFTGNEAEIRQALTAVRFPNNKARFIKEARDIFLKDGVLKIKEYIIPADVKATREFFVKTVKGIGYKEASHFLRNIGHGSDIAILDVHIIRNMIRYGLIAEKPVSISKACYIDMEEKLRRFSLKTGIPMDEMDILFWSMETGVIFK
jgi:N-glycosylase/DNA lyase